MLVKTVGEEKKININLLPGEEVITRSIGDKTEKN